MVVLGVSAAQLEQDFVTARIGAQTIPQERFGLGDFAHSLPQPIGGNRVSLNAVRIQFGRKLQPRQDFPHLRTVAQVAGSGGMPLGSTLIQMRVNGGEKLAAERVNPIAWFAEEPDFVALIVAANRPAVLGHVRRLEGLAIVEDRWVKAAVEVGVGL